MTALTVDEIVTRYQQAIADLQAENAALEKQVSALQADNQAKVDEIKALEALKECYKNTMKAVHPALGYPDRSRFDALFGPVP